MELQYYFSNKLSTDLTGSCEYTLYSDIHIHVRYNWVDLAPLGTESKTLWLYLYHPTYMYISTLGNNVGGGIMYMYGVCK